MFKIIAHTIYAFVFAFVSVALVAGDVPDLTTAANVVAWGGIVLPFGTICIALWFSTRPGVDMAESLRPLAEEPEQPLIEVAKIVALGILLLASGWVFALFAFLSLEICTMVMLLAIKRYVAGCDKIKLTEGAAVVGSVA